MQIFYLPPHNLCVSLGSRVGVRVEGRRQNILHTGGKVFCLLPVVLRKTTAMDLVCFPTDTRYSTMVRSYWKCHEKIMVLMKQFTFHSFFTFCLQDCLHDCFILFTILFTMFHDCFMWVKYFTPPAYMISFRIESLFIYIVCIVHKLSVTIYTPRHGFLHVVSLLHLLYIFCMVVSLYLWTV